MMVEDELVAFLGEYVTENKRDKISAVLEDRTRHISVLLEDIYQPHNASACLRSCDCLGVQDIHIVESRNEYRPNNEIAMGSHKWLKMQRYHQTASAIETLKSRGYRLVATTPNENGYDLVSLPLDQPVALMFGTEEQGLTDEALAAADCTLRLPMYGFTQSYNISVTLAMTLSRLVERLRTEEVNWQLSEDEKRAVRLDWYRAIIKRHELLEEAFWKRRES
ncbi:MAG: RNA methyltransferase [Verrucomicrobiota bacterium]